MGPCTGHKVAAYAIYKARSSKKVDKVWPEEFETTFRVAESEMSEIARTLLREQRAVSELLKSE